MLSHTKFEFDSAYYVGLCRQNVCTFFRIYLYTKKLSGKCRHVGDVDKKLGEIFSVNQQSRQSRKQGANRCGWLPIDFKLFRIQSKTSYP